MGLRTIYQDIETEVRSMVDASGNTLFQHTHTWNNQFKDLLGDTNNDVSIPFPACFIEINVDRIETQGNRNQLWNCTLILHIAHELYNAQDGEFEQNWEVLDLVDRVWYYMHTYKPIGCSEMVCIENKQDYNHHNLYHFIQSYKFVYEQTYSQGTIELYPWEYQLTGKTWIPG